MFRSEMGFKLMELLEIFGGDGKVIGAGLDWIGAEGIEGSEAKLEKSAKESGIFHAAWEAIFAMAILVLPIVCYLDCCILHLFYKYIIKY